MRVVGFRHDTEQDVSKFALFIAVVGCVLVLDGSVARDAELPGHA